VCLVQHHSTPRHAQDVCRPLPRPVPPVPPMPGGGGARRGARGGSGTLKTEGAAWLRRLTTTRSETGPQGCMDVYLRAGGFPPPPLAHDDAVRGDDDVGAAQLPPPHALALGPVVHQHTESATGAWEKGVGNGWVGWVRGRARGRVVVVVGGQTCLCRGGLVRGPRGPSE